MEAVPGSDAVGWAQGVLEEEGQQEAVLHAASVSVRVSSPEASSIPRSLGGGRFLMGEVPL